MATACGESINIPIIIRSLSKDFYKSAVRQNYSIPLDRSFLLALDANLASAGGIVIDDYHLDWWTKRTFSQSDQVLNISNLDACLEFHRTQIAAATEEVPMAETEETRLNKPVYIWKPDASDAISPNDSCRRCRLYRAVSLGTHDEERDIRNMIHGTEVSLSAKKSQVLRRAAGFHQLFEYLNIKEAGAAATDGNIHPNIYPPSQSQPFTDDTLELPKINTRSTKGKKISTRRRLAADVRLGAIADVERLQNSPSLKWTWGVDMDVSELVNLQQSAEPGRRLPHTGYATSLPEGNQTRTYSSWSTDQGNQEEYFSDVGENVSAVPELHADNVPAYPQCCFNGIPSRYLVNFIDDPLIPMDAVRPTTGRFQQAPSPLLPIPAVRSHHSHHNDDGDDVETSDISEEPDIGQAVQEYLAMSTSDPLPSAEVRRSLSVGISTAVACIINSGESQSPPNSPSPSPISCEEGAAAAGRAFLDSQQPLQPAYLSSRKGQKPAEDQSSSLPHEDDGTDEQSSSSSSTFSHEPDRDAVARAYLSSRKGQMPAEDQSSSLPHEDDGAAAATQKPHKPADEQSSSSSSPLSHEDDRTAAAQPFLTSEQQQKPAEEQSSTLSHENDGTAAAAREFLSSQQPLQPAQQPRKRYTAEDFDYVPDDWIE
jgi:hypothetical protein